MMNETGYPAGRHEHAGPAGFEHGEVGRPVNAVGVSAYHNTLVGSDLRRYRSRGEDGAGSRLASANYGDKRPSQQINIPAIEKRAWRAGA